MCNDEIIEDHSEVQYIQACEYSRLFNTLAWQIPTAILAITGSVYAIAFTDSIKVEIWQQGFLIFFGSTISLSLVISYYKHRFSNQIAVNVLYNIEKKWFDEESIFYKAQFTSKPYISRQHKYATPKITEEEMRKDFVLLPRDFLEYSSAWNITFFLMTFLTMLSLSYGFYLGLSLIIPKDIALRQTYAMYFLFIIFAGFVFSYISPLFILITKSKGWYNTIPKRKKKK